MVTTTRLECRSDEVESDISVVMFLMMYIGCGALVGAVMLARALWYLKSRKRKLLAKVMHRSAKHKDRGDEEEEGDDEEEEVELSSPQGGHKRETLVTQQTGMAIKRLLFQKMHRGFLEDDEGSDDGYIAEDVRPKQKNGRQPWETDVKKIKFKRKIGAGNFGEVWVGTWMQSTVAIKTVLRSMASNKEFVGKFIDEIQLMSELNHPNIVMFLGASIQPPSICLVIEYCVHGNLIEFLQSAKTKDINISMHLILKMALDIARGIKYLHEKMQIIQRDIKGRNVLVDENLNAKLSDFGLSRIKSKDDAGLTACGTPAWTAPEVVRMEEYTEKVDVYSFGVVLWELIMRSEPYDGEGGIQIAYAAAEQGLRPQVPKFAPDRYCALMEECWADSPDHRPNFPQILERLFQMMKDESNPFKAAEFYFGCRNHTHDAMLENLLDDNELNRELFDEDFSAILEERKGMGQELSKEQKDHITRRNSGSRLLQTSFSEGSNKSLLVSTKRVSQLYQEVHALAEDEETDTLQHHGRISSKSILEAEHPKLKATVLIDGNSRPTVSNVLPSHLLDPAEPTIESLVKDRK